MTQTLQNLSKICESLENPWKFGWIVVWHRKTGNSVCKIRQFSEHCVWIMRIIGNLCVTYRKSLCEHCVWQTWEFHRCWKLSSESKCPRESQPFYRGKALRRRTYWRVHILGVGRGPNKAPYHTFIPYKYWLLTLSQKKVMYLRNLAPKSSFSEGFPLKPCILHY